MEQTERKKAIYSYILGSLLEWYKQETGIKDGEDIRMPMPKLALFPFYIATANGCSKSLYKELGPFVAGISGPYATFMNNYENDDVIKKEGLLFLLEKGNINALRSSAESEIKKTIAKDDTAAGYITIKEALDNAIEELKRQTKKHMITFDYRDLAIRASYFRGYANKKMAREFYKPIEYNEIKSDKDILR